MAKKKVDVVKKLEGDQSIEDVLSPFVDPTNSQAVQVRDKNIIINTTQVSKGNIDKLADSLKELDVDYTVVEVHGHPSTVEL